MLASIPAAAAGILLRDYFERTFHSMPALGWQFLLTAAILWSTRYAIPRATATGLPRSTRSSSGWPRRSPSSRPSRARGYRCRRALERALDEAAAEFSFIMSIIVIAGSGVMEARHLPPGGAAFTLPLLTAFVAAAVSGLLAFAGWCRCFGTRSFTLCSVLRGARRALHGLVRLARQVTRGSLRWLDLVGSTQDAAHGLAAAGGHHGSAIAARVRTAGQGTRRRKWISSEGGLWLSVVCRPQQIAGIEAVSLRVGLALAALIERWIPRRPDRHQMAQ